MKFLFLSFFASLALSVDVWTSFVNEEGAELGAEMAASFETQRGGGGGGAWSDDCDSKGGLKSIRMKCGTYPGLIQLKCKNGDMPSRGAARGSGSGGEINISDASGITKVVIQASTYVGNVKFYRGNTQVGSTCGRGGGSTYTVTAPPGKQLCAMKGRSGWWTDALAAGWCAIPCPGHCEPKPKPPAPMSLAQAAQKRDTNSYNRGNDIRRWFSGATLAGNADKISGSVYYRDQGWGNKKTDVFFCCNCGATNSASNCVSLCGTNVRGSFKKCTFNKSVPASCTKGKSTCVGYRVGGGGGHQFYGKNFSGSVSYKSALLEALDITFDGLFVSSVEYAEAQTNYFSHVAVGFGGLVFGLAGVVYLRRKQAAEYQSLV